MGDKSFSTGSNVYAIIVTHNGSPWIADCLKSLALSRDPVKVIVVDNASTDETPLLLSRFPDVICLPQEKNLGFGRANNIGIRRALQEGANLVFLLNQDARVDPGTIGKLIRCAQENSHFGVLSPLHLNGDGTEIDTDFIRFIAQGAKDFLSDLYLGRTRSVYPISFANAAAWLLTRECLNRVGGFDPLFFMYGEDDDFCDRAVFHGFRVGLAPSAIIFHNREATRPARERRWTELQWRANKMTSAMLVALKRPSSSFVLQILLMVTDTGHQGLRSLLSRDWTGAAALMLAVVKVALRLPRIWQHRRISRTAGPHWI